MLITHSCVPTKTLHSPTEGQDRDSDRAILGCLSFGEGLWGWRREALKRKEKKKEGGWNRE